MNISILYYLLSVGFALLIAAALYYIPKKKKSCYLFGLRFLSVLSLLTLLINPKWEREELTIEKPQLVIAVDNSASIAFVKGKETVENILSELNKNTNLQDKFTIKHYSFGKQTKVFDSLTFAENQSNPTDLIRQMDALSSREKTPIFLITDGNQTLGTSYEYVKTKNKVFPIIVGDTTQYTDLAITKINVNQYSFLDNQFPVEIFTLYTGIQNTGAQLSIFNNKKRN